MDILVYGRDADTALGRMCARGLRDLSHDVIYVTPRLTGIPLVGEVGKKQTRERLIECAASYRPDVVLVIGGTELNRETVRRVRTCSDAVVTNWNPDNPYQARSEERIAHDYLDSLPAYDIVFTWGEFLEEPLLEDGAKDVRHLPFGYDPELHRPMEPEEEYACDVAFLGHYSPKRERHLSELVDFDFQLRGNAWRLKCWNWPLRKCLRGPALSGDAYATALSSAKLVVNVVADHNLPAYNMRTFEVPATGSAMVTTRTAGQQVILPEGDAAAMYADPDELREVVDYYLDADEERRELAANGHSRIQSHSYRDRMETLIEATRDHR